MGNYSKLVAAIVNAMAVVALWAGVPEELITTEIKAAITAILGPILVFIFPKNVES